MGESKKSENLLLSIIYIIFFVYILMIIRIILFRDVPIYAISKGTFRTVNLIPFYTIYQFIVDSNIDFMKATINIIENIGIFIPMGIFLPIVCKNLNKKTIIITIILVSLAFELTQYIFALGSSDIDDVILNSLGGIIGITIYINMNKLFPNDIKRFKVIIATSLILGVIGLGVISKNYHNLLTFKFRPDKKISKILIEENREIIKDINKDTVDIVGTFESFKKGIITIKAGSNNKVKRLENLIDSDGNIRIYLNENTKLVSYIITKESKMDIVKYEEFDVKNLDLLRRYDTINVWIDKENQPKDKHGIMASKLLIGLYE
ncbi:TPA: VanZ family protein [Clostridioides difficile]|uniref:VanZ family protein n=1 Tax=Clostridioides difficile TaxID=1496 RepID=UPI0003B288DF|nr:VanZ family protein [Clostridioides difficile]MBJ9769795.1 VanZ family protein [Clostridioides difficile]MCE0687856.1 VanZ family protein [Clostridioides difficile]MCE0713250.1 VanZ family protein [Clostridioides difficile]MCE0719612.1 VanZ family protein [Clostridioides difficile]MCE0728749.1 VanZ family protein [Clostridioides difficile]